MCPVSLDNICLEGVIDMSRSFCFLLLLRLTSIQFKLFYFPLKITFANKSGRFDLEVTTFQMAVLFSWNERPHERISFENLRSVHLLFVRSS